MTSEPQPVSARSFGFTLAAMFGALGAYKYWSGARPTVFLSLFSLCLLLGVAAVTAPRVLVPVRKLWFRCGEVLGYCTRPVVLAVIFFGILTPVAVIARLCGRDPLKLRIRPGESHWSARSASAATADSFRHPF